MSSSFFPILYNVSNIKYVTMVIVYKGHTMVSLIINFINYLYLQHIPLKSSRIIFQIIDFNFHLPKTIKIFGGNTILILLW